MLTLKTASALFIGFFLICSATFAQPWGISGQGPKVTKTLDIEKFNGLTLAVGGKVYLRQGSNQSVKIEGQQNIIDNLKTKVEDGVWRIGFDKSVRNHEGLTIWITVPTLTKASISGSGSIIGESAFSGLGKFETSISGSGDIKLNIEAGEVNSAISGSGDINLSGSAKSLAARISGSGDIQAESLHVQTCDIRISGSGDCQVQADDSLTVSTSGSGDVYYRGRPKVSAKVSGSGKVQPKE